MWVYGCVGVRVRVCVCVRAHVCMRVCMCTCCPILPCLHLVVGSVTHHTIKVSCNPAAVHHCCTMQVHRAAEAKIHHISPSLLAPPILRYFRLSRFVAVITCEASPHRYIWPDYPASLNSDTFRTMDGAFPWRSVCFRLPVRLSDCVWEEQ